MSGISLNIGTLKDNIEKVTESLGGVKAYNGKLKIEISKNKLNSLDKFVSVVDKFDLQLNKFGDSYTKGLNDLLEGVKIMENLDQEIAKSVKKASSNINSDTKGKSSKRKGF